MTLNHPIHRDNQATADAGIPTLHEEGSLSTGEDAELSRLRFSLGGVRSNLNRLAGPHPDGTCMDDPNSSERKWADTYGCGHPKDPGFTISRISFLCRTAGLGHPEVAALLNKLTEWEGRLSGDFEAVRDEFIAWSEEKAKVKPKMFRDWLKELS